METKTHTEEHREKRHEIVFFIDKEEFKVHVHELTVQQLIVEYAKEDPTQTTLGLKEGNHIEKLTDLNREVHLKDGMHFVLFHNEPTPVS
jgi:hypothetical protein